MQEAGESGWRRRVRHQLACRLGVDVRGLAAYRIAAATLLLADLLVYRLPDLAAFYTDAGVLPRSLLAEVFPVASALSLHTVTGSFAGQAILLAGSALAAVTLLVGYRTRLAAIVTWLLLASMHARNPHVLNAGDTLLLVTLFFGLFVPLGERWSIDALRSGEERSRRTVATPATAGLLLQIVVVYATNAVFKTRSPRWMDGSAVRYVFALDDFTVRLGDALAQVPELLVATNWVWFVALAASPLLLALTGWPRATYAGLLATLHVGMLATMMLGLFPLVSIAALLLVLPPVAWDRLEARLEGPARALAAPVRARIPTGARGPSIPSAWRDPGRDLVHSALAVLVALGLAWHGMALGFLPKPAALDEAGRAAEHEWRMFSPPSTTYGYVTAPTELADGSTIDAVHQRPYTAQPPEDLADAYPSTLWHRYLKDLPDVTDAEQAALADHLCQRTAETYEPSVERIELVYVEHEVRLDGPDPLQRYTVHAQSCSTSSR